MASRAWFCVLGVAALAACGDDPSPVEPPPPAMVVVRTDAASVAECPFGGSIVSSGVDGNGDQRLGDDEVRVRTVLCQDAPTEPGPPIVARVLSEPPGAHCPLGGAAVESGPDRNGNGQLDADEVAQTSYVCGERLVTRISIEPAGERCVVSGILFEAGLDHDGDSLLDTDEVASSRVSCGDVVTGDVSITSNADVQALAGLRAITGDLVINEPVTEVFLPLLTHVGGNLFTNGQPHLTRVAMPRLLDVGRLLSLQGDVRGLAFPLLERVGALTIAGTTGLANLDTFARLETITGAVVINSNTALVSAGLRAFSVGRIAGPIQVVGNPALVGLSISGLTNVRSVVVASNGVVNLGIDGPAEPGNTLGAVSITNNPALVNVALFNDRLDSVTVTGNPSLINFDLSAVRVLGGVTVTDNPALHAAFLHLPTGVNGRGPLVIEGAISLAGPIAIFGTSDVIARGDVTLEGTELAHLRFREPFDVIGGKLRLAGNPLLEDVVVVPVGGGVELVDNAALQSVQFRLDPGELTDHVLHGGVTVTGNPALVDAGFLTGITKILGGVEISNDALIAALPTDALTEVIGGVRIAGCPKLAALDLDHVARIGGDLRILDNAALTAVVLPLYNALAAQVEVSRNAVLHELALPSLEVADLHVIDNPVLPACAVAALFAQITGTHVQSGNDTTAVCAPH